MGLVGRPLGDHGDDPVRLRGQVRDPLAVAVRLLVVGALPPGERVPVADEPVPVQVLADVVLERLIRGAAAGRPVAGESDCVPVADPVRVHGHVAGERRVEIVFVSAVRGRVPAVEPVAGNLARVAGRPTGFVGGGRVVGHGLRCGRAGRVAAGGRVHAVRQGGVDGPQCVYGLRPGGHDDLRPDVRVQRVPVHGVADGHVPVVGVRVRAPTVERAVGLADLAGIPAVGVGLRGRQCDPGAGRIIDLAAGYGARRGDGLHAHGTVGSGDRPLAGPVILSGGRVGQHPAVVRDGSGFRFGALVGRKPDRAIRPGCGGFGPARLGARGHLAGSAVPVVAEPVGLGEAQIVEDVAVDVVAGAYRLEGEAGDRPGGDVRAGVGLPLPVMVTAGMVRLMVRLGVVAHLRGDDLADVARLVAVAVDGGSPRVLGGFLAGFADHDAHPVEVVPVEAGVLQRPAVGHARDGGDVLVDGGARLSRDEFRVLVAGLGVLLQFDSLCDLLPVGSLGLGRLPCEFGGVPSRDWRPGVLVDADVPRVSAVDRVDDGPVVPRVFGGDTGDQAGRIVERAVDQFGRQTVGLAGDGLHLAIGGGLDLRRALLGPAVRVVAELVGEAEAQVVDDAVIGGGSKSTVLGDAPVGDHRAGLSGGDDDRALVGFPVVGMVPRIVGAFRGVRGIGVRVGDGSYVAGLVPVFRSGLGDRGAGQFDRGEMVLVGAGEQCDSARVAFGPAGVADTERVGGSRCSGDRLGDRTACVYVGGRVPVLLAMQFEVLDAAGGVHVLPGERGGGQAAGLHARLSGHGLRVGADHALIGRHIHPGQALPLLRNAPFRYVEPAVHGQLVTRSAGGDGLRPRGLRLAEGLRADPAGLFLGSAVRVVAEPVCDLERQIVDQVALGRVHGVQGFESERADRRVRRDRDLALVGRPLAVMLETVGVGRVRGDARTGPTLFVTRLVAGDAGHGHGLAVDQNLHRVRVLLGQARMVETHRVYGVRIMLRVDLL